MSIWFNIRSIAPLALSSVRTERDQMRTATMYSGNCGKTIGIRKHRIQVVYSVLLAMVLGGGLVVAPAYGYWSPGGGGDTPAPPDTDGDGLTDGLDLCPYDPGPVENLGCPMDWPPDGDDDTPAPPDADGDGLTDDVDLCPSEPGPVENQGCPMDTVDALIAGGQLGTACVQQGTATAILGGGEPDRAELRHLSPGLLRVERDAIASKASRRFTKQQT